MLLCFIIFYFQQENREAIDAVVDKYCQSIYEPDKKYEEYDYMRRNKESCWYYLTMMNELPADQNWLEYNKKRFGKKYTTEELEKFAVFEEQHFKKVVALGIPKSLDAKLMYYPDTYNPFKMLTSALSHADWSHIIFNLIFFFAFAPALEIISQSKLKFISVFLAVELVGGVLYSITSMLADSNIPTLGLSGSVSGMIGFSAFMMPWARIRTIFWIWIHVVRSYAIPAWILASWFIGWDVYYLFTSTENAGVNFLAHASGGITGYLMGYFFFKREKEAAQYELGVEIDYMRSKRESLSSIATLFKGDRNYIDNKQREHEGIKEYAKYNESLYREVKAGHTSEAVVLLVEKYDLFAESFEIYIELFTSIGEWKKKRVYFCAGRLIVDLLVEKKKVGKLTSVLKHCLEEDPDFVLGDPDDLLFVTKQLIESHEYNLAYQLIHNAEEKYGEYINTSDCLLLEAKILWEHLDREADAIALLSTELGTATEQDSIKLKELIDLIRS